MNLKIIPYTLALSISIVFGGFSIIKTVSANQPETEVKSIWSVFSSTEGSFRILMPGKPTETSEKIKTKTGEIEVKMFSVEREEEGSKYTVAYIDYPREYIDMLTQKNLVEKAINTGKDTALKKANGTIISEEKITLAGYPGKEFNYTKPGDKITKHRIFLVGNRLYQLSAEVTQKKQQYLNKSISGFCDSFKLLK